MESQQLSAFHGRPFESHRTLQSYGVQADSTLQLLGRLQGGKPVKVRLKQSLLSQAEPPHISTAL